MRRHRPHWGLVLSVAGFGVMLAVQMKAAEPTAPAVGDPARLETAEQRDARMAWWREARFGMFIHWGLYSVAAGEWEGRQGDTGTRGSRFISSWLMSRQEIDPKDYERLMAEFTAERYDPREWARLAKAAGMRYVVLTSKHHEGFCLFDSKLTDFKATNTPARRDLVRMLLDAFRAEGLKVGLYYSLIDWHHPGYPVKGDRIHPMRNNADYCAQTRDFDPYVEYLHGQVRELLTDYGPIDIMWFDFSYGEMAGEKWRAGELLKMVRTLHPGIIVNDRLESGENRQDPNALYSGEFGTPEQFIPATGLTGRDWETCMTMNDTWGFKKHDNNWKSTETLVRMLIDTASKGGNLLLNVGPLPDGTIPQPSVERLRGMGRWMDANGESIYGTTASPFRQLRWGRATCKGSTLYLQVFDWPSDDKLVVPGLCNAVKSACLLATGKVLKTTASGDDVVIEVPREPIDPVATVLKLELDGEPQVDNALRAGPDGAITLSAGLATCHGEALEYYIGHGTRLADYLRHWNTLGDYATWEVKVDRAGRYDVEVTWSCAKPSAGSTYRVSCDDAAVEGTVAGTTRGSQPVFRTDTIGSLDLPADHHTITVKALTKSSETVMTLKSIVLRGVASEPE